MLRILGISGSLRRESHNTDLLRAAADALPPGVELEVFDGLRDLPPYDADVDVEPAHPGRGAPASSDRRRRRRPDRDARVQRVDSRRPEERAGLGVAAVSRNSLRGKPVAVVGASTGLFGAVWAQAETRKVLGVIGADVIDHELPVGQADTAFGVNGELVEPEQRAALAELVNILSAQAAAQEQAPSLAA